MKDFFNVVLFNPEIPQNTGNIARMCAANEVHLHLIEPLGFELSDKYLKRSAMDYWQHLNYTIYKDWEDFLERNSLTEANFNAEGRLTEDNASQDDLARVWFLSSKVEKSMWDYRFLPQDYLVFGSEGGGVPAHFYKDFVDTMLTVPMRSKAVRCLNLAVLRKQSSMKLLGRIEF